MSSKKDKESHVKSGSTASLHQKLHVETPDSDELEAEVLPRLTYEEMKDKLTETEQKASQHWERLLRMQAEHENALRRAERDVTNAHKYGIEKFVSELLPIIDNMERSLQMPLNEKSDDSAVLEGVSLTLKMFNSALEKFGVQQVDPMGEAFNSELHQAVSMQVDNDVTPGTVLNVLQKGYTLNNRLIRPAFVVVAKTDLEK